MESDLHVQFKILSVIRDDSQPYIIVRHLQPDRYFSLGEKPSLNNVLIKPLITSVSSKNENGKPCNHTYAFYPIVKKDIDKFKKDTIVDLST